MQLAGVPPTLHALTSVRFVAALAVVLHHYAGFLPYPAWLAAVAAQGQAGVCFFFILSGFILTYNYQAWFATGASGDACRAFYRARFARVYPLHLVMLVAATPIVLGQWFLMPGAPAAPSFKLLGASWLAHLTLLQAWVPSPLLQNLWNAPAWSISAEFFFYLVFPFATAGVIVKCRRPGQLLGLAAALLALEALVALGTARVFAGGFDLHGVTAAHGGLHWVVSAWAPLRVGEFLIGCVVGALFLANQRGPVVLLAPFSHAGMRNALLLASLAGAYLLCLLPVPDGAGGFAFWVLRHHVLFVPFFAVTILCLAEGRTLLSWLLDRPAVQLLGESSYALYLLHALPLMVLGYYVHPVGPLGPLLAMALSVLLAIACFKLVETPARRWLRGGRGGAAHAG